MTDLQRKSGLVSAVVISILNALVGFGIVPLDQTGVALLNGAASSIAALALHILGADK
jgi:hypothetical protein